MTMGMGLLKKAQTSLRRKKEPGTPRVMKESTTAYWIKVWLSEGKLSQDLSAAMAAVFAF